jgi:HK97 family phage major capsid protein
MFASGEILSRVDTRTVTGNSIAYNVIDQTSRADGSRQGGVLGYWVDEGTAPTASNTKLARIELKLRKVGAYGAMTDELLSDAAALGGELETAFAAELMFQVENKIYRGNGASAPLGFLNAACLVSVAKETNQAAATINTTTSRRCGRACRRVEEERRVALSTRNAAAARRRSRRPSARAACIRDS